MDKETDTHTHAHKSCILVLIDFDEIAKKIQLLVICMILNFSIILKRLKKLKPLSKMAFYDFNV